MYSVTQRIKNIKQPRGGYVPRKSFEIIELNDNTKLNEDENIHGINIGLAVDYLTRTLMGTSREEAFRISLRGASIAGESKNAEKLIKNIDGLNDDSIISACQLSGYDIWVRNNGIGFNSVNTIRPDKYTIENIRIMVNRSLDFWEQYGPITKDGFTFELGGYTDIISTGDGDFLTLDTLWDFKVSKSEPTSKDTLQILIYYLMGKHSINPIFEYITKIGIYNPRLNKVYIKDVSTIDETTIEIVEKEIIGYK